MQNRTFTLAYAVEISVDGADTTSITLTSAVIDRRVYRSKHQIYIGAPWHDSCC